MRLARSLGGYVGEVQYATHGGKRGSARVVLRVPVGERAGGAGDADRPRHDPATADRNPRRHAPRRPRVAPDREARAAARRPRPRRKRRRFARICARCEAKHLRLLRSASLARIVLTLTTPAHRRRPAEPVPPDARRRRRRAPARAAVPALRAGRRGSAAPARRRRTRDCARGAQTVGPTTCSNAPRRRSSREAGRAARRRRSRVGTRRRPGGRSSRSGSRCFRSAELRKIVESSTPLPGRTRLPTTRRPLGPPTTIDTLGAGPFP